MEYKEIWNVYERQGLDDFITIFKSKEEAEKYIKENIIELERKNKLKEIYTLSLYAMHCFAAETEEEKEKLKYGLYVPLEYLIPWRGIKRDWFIRVESYKEKDMTIEKPWLQREYAYNKITYVHNGKKLKMNKNFYAWFCSYGKVSKDSAFCPDFHAFKTKFDRNEAINKYELDRDNNCVCGEITRKEMVEYIGKYFLINKNGEVIPAYKQDGELFPKLSL